MAKSKYQETKNPKDITVMDYVFSILFSKEKLPVTKRYNYFMVNQMLAYDVMNVIHANEAGKRGLKGVNHYNFLMHKVKKRRGVKMSDVKLDKPVSKEEKTAKAVLCQDLHISMKELDQYLIQIGDDYLTEYIKENKKEIKKLVDAKTYA